MKHLRWGLYLLTIFLFLFIYNSFFNYEFVLFISTFLSIHVMHFCVFFSFLLTFCSILLMVKISSSNDSKAVIGILITLVLNLSFLLITGIIDFIGSLLT